MTHGDLEQLCPGCFRNKGRANPCPHCGFDERTPRPPNALPLRTLLHGQYLIGRILGRPGGFGITYLAYDRHLQARVAIKEYLPPDLATRGADHSTIVPHGREEGELFRYGLAQFLGEAQTLARLDHPNIVRIRQFFEANGSACLVMDYYRGLTLAEYLERQPDGRVAEREAVALMQPILDGLRAVHAVGFLHRDIKPQNIYLAQTESGGARPILIDFGAARQAMGERSRSLSVMLTDGYAPLEQYSRRGGQGPWTDVYAAAAVLYRLLTGRTPPPAPERASQDELLPASGFGVSQRVSDAITRALSMQPKARPQSAAAFQRSLSEGAIAPPPAPRPLQGPAPGPNPTPAPAPLSLIGTPDLRAFYTAIIGPRNTDWYLGRFLRFDAEPGRWASWNWPCFFLNVFWLLYRKMWLPALLWFLIQALISIVVAFGLGEALPTLTIEQLDLIDTVVSIGFNLLLVIGANRLYHWHARRLLARVRRKHGDGPALLPLLQDKGGTSALAAWGSAIVLIGLIALGAASA